MATAQPQSTRGRAAELLRAVQRIVGKHAASASRLDRVSYARDLWVRDILAVQAHETPDLPRIIAWPGNRDEVVELLRLANQRSVPIVPFGGGAGVCGAARGPGALILDVKRMHEIRSVDPDARTAHVEVGINGEWLERDLNRRGFTLGHFPSSIYCSTLGGFIAARSAGQLSTKYGKMEDMLAGLELVLPDGTPMEMNEWDPAASAHLDQLFSGSEGTLGVLTAARLKIHPVAEERTLMGFEFRGLERGMKAIQLMLQAGLRPAVVRLYDEFDTILALQGGRSSAESASRLPSLLDPKKVGAEILGLFPRLSKRGLSLLLSRPRVLNTLTDLAGKRCLLILMFEGPALITGIEAREGRRICRKAGGKDLGSGPGEHWLAKRYAVSYRQSRVFAAGAFNDTAEVAGTWDVLPNLYRDVKRAIGRHAFVMAHFSHAYPEGCSIYFTFVANGGDGDGSRKLYDRIWSDLLEATLEAGGTITHHHGVGRSKAHFLPDELGEGGMELLRNTKRALDPQGILNIGSLGLDRSVAIRAPDASRTGFSAFEQELSALVGSEHVREGRVARSFLGLKGPDPAEVLVVTPGAATEVGELVRLTHVYNVPLIVAGTTGRGLEIATWPKGHFVVLDTSRLDRVLEVDDQSLTVTTQAGIPWSELEAACNEQGYTLGFASAALAEGVSVGGLLASGLPPMASPLRGRAHEALVNLGFIAADGTRVRTRLTPRSAAGPDLKSLAVGGRGALCIITGATLRVYRRDHSELALVYRFKTPADAIEALHAIIRRGSLPIGARVWTDKKRAFVGMTFGGVQALAAAMRDIAVETLHSRGGIDAGDAEQPLTYVGLDVLTPGALPASKTSTLLAHGTFPQLIQAVGMAPLTQTRCPAFHARGGYLFFDGEESTSTLDDADRAARSAGLTILARGGEVVPLDATSTTVLGRIQAQIDPRGLLSPGLLPGTPGSRVEL